MRRRHRTAIRIVIATIFAAAGAAVAGALAGEPFAASLQPSHTKPTTTNAPHGGGDPSVQHTTESGGETPPPASVPATPAAPADPLNAGKNAFDAGAKQLAKDEAAAKLVSTQQLAEFICAFVFLYQVSGVGDNFVGDERTALNWMTFACMFAIAGEYRLLKTIDDPPNANFLEVALPTPLAGTGSFRCAKRITAARCVGLRSAFIRYRTALATSAAAITGMSSSMDRFSGADAAASAEGKQLQAAALKAYAGELAAALTSQYAAGRALAAALRANRGDVRLSAGTRKMLAKKLGSPDAFRASLVAKLITNGAVSDIDDFARTLRAAFSRPAPATTFAGAASAAPSTAPLVQLSRRLTAYEVAALVRALAKQGAIAGGTGETLLNDLRASLTATSPSAHNAALTRFVQDASVAQPAPAALLKTAAQALG